MTTSKRTPDMCDDRETRGAALPAARPASLPALTGGLPDVDRAQLQRHLRQCESARRPSSSVLTAVLKRKISGARALGNARPDDAVTGGCVVSYSIDDGPLRSGLLVHRARPGVGGGVIPVSSVLGATLIGMRVGQGALMLCDDGSRAMVHVAQVDAPS
ncbi:hypothetical protein [Roseobacter sp. N2S]|uniref:hypothetical protein n=1 Tax=Roseobacter sp. N2S TaxID=2663844 RepID=UPI0028627A57|nr:hypothetical protein [Roseobacter sp. N2S]MDR6266645.1 hypothetical protein [Roseobacter sp. N2S]